MSRSFVSHPQRGFTLIELAVSLAVIGILLALLIPAVQSARESAQNLACRNRMRQFGLAMHQYETTHQMFPPGNNGSPLGSFLVCMLPYLDQGNFYNSIDFSWELHSPEADRIMKTPLPLFHCPSESAPQLHNWSTTSYAGNYSSAFQVGGYNGMFRAIDSYEGVPYRTGPIRIRDVRDGLTNTAAISEWLHASLQVDHRLRRTWKMVKVLTHPDELEEFADLCASIPPNPLKYGYFGGRVSIGATWAIGTRGESYYNHVLPPNSPTCGNPSDLLKGAISAASNHPGGVNVLWADGHTTFTSSSIDRQVWRDVGSRVDHDFLYSPLLSGEGP